jgi:hypothetical protein
MVHALCQIVLMSEEYCLRTAMFSSPWLKPGDSKNGGIVDTPPPKSYTTYIKMRMIIIIRVT